MGITTQRKLAGVLALSGRLGLSHKIGGVSTSIYWHTSALDATTAADEGFAPLPSVAEPGVAGSPRVLGTRHRRPTNSVRLSALSRSNLLLGLMAGLQRLSTARSGADALRRLGLKVQLHAYEGLSEALELGS